MHCVYQQLLYIYIYIHTQTSVCLCSCAFVPGMEQCGACAGRTNEVDSQVSPPVVGQGEPRLNVL